MMLPLGFSPFNVGPTELIVVLVIVLILRREEAAGSGALVGPQPGRIQKGQGRGRETDQREGQGDRR